MSGLFLSALLPPTRSQVFLIHYLETVLASFSSMARRSASSPGRKANIVPCGRVRYRAKPILFTAEARNGNEVEMVAREHVPVVERELRLKEGKTELEGAGMLM